MLVEEIDRIFDLLTIQCNRELTKQAVLYLGRTYNCFPLRMYDRLGPYPHDWRLPFPSRLTDGSLEVQYCQRSSAGKRL